MVALSWRILDHILAKSWYHILNISNSPPSLHLEAGCIPCCNASLSFAIGRSFASPHDSVPQVSQSQKFPLASPSRGITHPVSTDPFPLAVDSKGGFPSLQVLILVVVLYQVFWELSPALAGSSSATGPPLCPSTVRMCLLLLSHRSTPRFISSQPGTP